MTSCFLFGPFFRIYNDPACVLFIELSLYLLCDKELLHGFDNDTLVVWFGPLDLQCVDGTTPGKVQKCVEKRIGKASEHRILLLYNSHRTLRSGYRLLPLLGEFLCYIEKV